MDLALERLSRAAVGADQCVVFALDADSFADLPDVRQVGMPGRRPSPTMLAATAQLAAAAATRISRQRVRLGELSRELHRASFILAVGGGYLRTGSAVASLGTLLNHVPQLSAAALARAPTLYLPQSIGPLPGPVGSLVRRYLPSVDAICARDDRSVAELGGLSNVRRVPDLAVLRLADLDVQLTSDGSGPVVCVARELGDGADYSARLHALARALPSAIWAVQTEGIGSKHDGQFYRRLGVQPEGRLLDVLARYPNSVVVSVRLHGALQALSLGVPAIHLSYQRKGWAAYADLGLDGFVHSARRFDPAAVARQATTLGVDASSFWRRISARYGMLADTSGELDRLVLGFVR